MSKIFKRVIANGIVFDYDEYREDIDCLTHAAMVTGIAPDMLEVEHHDHRSGTLCNPCMDALDAEDAPTDMPEQPNPEPLLTYDEAIERLSPTYELVFAARGDQFSDEQVNALLADDYDSVQESTWEWESECQHESASIITKEEFSSEEWFSLSAEDQFAIEDEIRERDASTWFGDLLNNTPNPLLRVLAIDEDDAFSFEPVEPGEVLDAIGFEHTEHNLKVIGEALNEASPEYSVIMGSWIFSADLKTLVDTPPSATITVQNPHLWLGNPFAGSGWLTDKPLEGEVTLKRSDIETDKQAFGYSIQDVYRGLNVSEYESEITITKDGE